MEQLKQPRRSPPSQVEIETRAERAVLEQELRAAALPKRRHNRKRKA